MSERLTDEELRELAGMGAAFLPTRAAGLLERSIAELRQQRLASEEVEALRWLRHDAARELNPVEDDGCSCASCERQRLALSVLDKLIAAAGGE